MGNTRYIEDKSLKNTLADKPNINIETYQSQVSIFGIWGSCSFGVSIIHCFRQVENLNYRYHIFKLLIHHYLKHSNQGNDLMYNLTTEFDCQHLLDFSCIYNLLKDNNFNHISNKHYLVNKSCNNLCISWVNIFFIKLVYRFNDKLNKMMNFNKQRNQIPYKSNHFMNIEFSIMFQIFLIV